MAEQTFTVEELLVKHSPSREKFSKLDADRTSVLDRARECSKLTIPSVVTDSGHTESDDLDTPYQAVGSRLVHNLASKLLLTLLPPNTSFFRLLPDPEVIQLAQQQQQGGKDQLEKSLVTLEQEIMKQIEREALRVPIFESIKSLIISGNALLYKTQTGLKSYKLANYVISRDFSGNPIEIICKEEVTKDILPEDILQQIENDPTIQDSTRATI